MKSSFSYKGMMQDLQNFVFNIHLVISFSAQKYIVLLVYRVIVSRKVWFFRDF